MTASALICHHCDQRIKSAWRGYVPYYDEEYTRRFVLIAPEYLEAVTEIEHLAPIVVTRGKSKIEPVVIRPKIWRTQPIPHSTERERPVDLALFCVRVLWCDDILAAWDKAERSKAKTLQPATQHTKTEKKPTMYTAAHARAGKIAKEQELSASLRDVFPNMLSKVKPSSNGEHTKTDEAPD